MEDNTFRKSYKEKLDVSTIKSKLLEHTKFKLIEDGIYYFNCTESRNMFDCYLDVQLESLVKTLKSLDKRFIDVNAQKVLDTDFEVLQYYFPALNNSGNQYDNSKALLNYINYSGGIQSGLIYYDYSTSLLYVIEVPSTDSLETFDLFFEGFYQHIKTEIEYVNDMDCCYSPIYYEDEIDMNDEDREAIKQIVNKLNALKEKGSYLSLLPVLDNYLKEQSNNNIKLSRLHIDQEYKIYLTDYDIEIKLSHLTKTIYFFFLVMQDGIQLSDLAKYKNHLLNIYLTVSNQDNLQKMSESIDLLVYDKNAIYVHLSRIKGTFHKIIDSRLAENYCIRGEKEEAKSIKVSRDLTNIYDFTEQWKIPSSVYQTKPKRNVKDNLYGHQSI